MTARLLLYLRRPTYLVFVFRTSSSARLREPLQHRITGLHGGTLNVVLDPVGDIRCPNVNEFDLSIAKGFRFFKRTASRFPAICSTPRISEASCRDSLPRRATTSRKSSKPIRRMLPATTTAAWPRSRRARQRRRSPISRKRSSSLPIAIRPKKPQSI